VAGLYRLFYQDVQDMEVQLGMWDVQFTLIVAHFLFVDIFIVSDAAFNGYIAYF
jgi:hypothetical protein